MDMPLSLSRVHYSANLRHTRPDSLCLLWKKEVAEACEAFQGEETEGVSCGPKEGSNLLSSSSS